MPTYDYLALTPITVTAPDVDTAAHCARALLDDAHATVDETCVGADITTGSTRLTHRGQLADLAKIIRSEADVALRGGTLSRTMSLHRIAAFAEQQLDALGAGITPPEDSAEGINARPTTVPDHDPGILYADGNDGARD